MKHPRVDPCVTFFNRFKPVEREARLDDDDDDEEEEEEEEDGIYRRERGVGAVDSTWTLHSYRPTRARWWWS